MAGVQLLSNHGMALVCVARDPEARLRDIAHCLGITERSAHRIVTDLVQQGYLTRERRGARNHYQVQTDHPLPEPLLRNGTLTALLRALAASPDQQDSNDRHDAAPDAAQPARPAR